MCNPITNARVEELQEKGERRLFPTHTFDSFPHTIQQQRYSTQKLPEIVRSESEQRKLSTQGNCGTEAMIWLSEELLRGMNRSSKPYSLEKN